MSLKSLVRHSRKQHKAGRANYGFSDRRPRFETLEDRRLLSFTPAVNYAAGGSPWAIATADFNGDENLDLATIVGYYSSNPKVSVRLGDGAGGFGAAQEFAVPGYYPSSIFIADFNNDTRPDMVVGDASGFHTLMGNGNGTFQPAVYTIAGGGVVAVGRFNNDSNIDVLVNWIDGDWWTHVQVYGGNGQGGFTAGVDAYSSGWDGMAAVDLNNDGNLDVATGEGLVFLNVNGWLQFDWGQQALLNGGAIATGDFTGEGNADVIVASDTQLAVLRGRGDGGFHAPIHYSVNGPPHSAVATADFNADGKLDAVVTDKNAATVSVLLGNGDGTLRFGGASATGTSPWSVAVGDFNRDGRPDVAVANAGSNNVSVLLNDGVWSVAPELPGDYNRDSSVDAADYVMWRKFQGTPVPPSTGADGNGDGAVDQDDYGEWQERFGQTSPPPTASSDVTVGDAQPAVEVRGASEKQRAKMARESAFVELAAPLTRSRAVIRDTVRSSPGATTAIEASQPDVAHWLSQSDSKQAVTEWENGNKLEDDDTSNADDPLSDSIDEVFALLANG